MDRKDQIKYGIQLCRMGMEMLNDANLQVMQTPDDEEADIDDEISDLYNMFQEYGDEALSGIEIQVLDDEDEN